MRRISKTFAQWKTISIGVYIAFLLAVSVAVYSSAYTGTAGCDINSPISLLYKHRMLPFMTGPGYSRS